MPAALRMRLSQADTSSYLLLQERSARWNPIKFVMKAPRFLLPRPGRTHSTRCSALPAPLAAEQSGHCPPWQSVLQNCSCLKRGC